VLLPDPIQKLVSALERLPGIGPKSASRLAFFFLRAPEEVAEELSEALSKLKAKTAFCEECFNITVAGMARCEVCADSKRDPGILCVVEEALDVLALERVAVFSGRYHVLHGVLSALFLQQRLKSSGVQITRLARGLPVGGDLEYADQNTLLKALSGRQEMG
jgi:recombination protein RecR